MSELSVRSETAVGPVSPARRFTDAAEAPTTVIGASIQIKGELTGTGACEIAGTLEGECRVEGLCRVRPGAHIKGDVTATHIVVEGELTGRTLVADRVEIGATGRVRANIRAPLVAIAEGAFFEGQVDMESADGSAGPTAFKEKRKGRGE
jgi:cytoskeletal protein CcmA (bactofilin family)